MTARPPSTAPRRLPRAFPTGGTIAALPGALLVLLVAALLVAPASVGAADEDASPDASPRGVDRATSEDPEQIERRARQRYLDGDLVSAAELYVEAGRRSTEPERRAETLVTASWLQHLLERDEEAIGSLTEALAASPDHPVDAALYSADFADLLAEARRRTKARPPAEPLESSPALPPASTAPATPAVEPLRPEPPADPAARDGTAAAPAESAPIAGAELADPDDLEGLRLAAGTLRRAGDPERAAELLSAGLARHPGHPGLLLDLGMARRDQGRPEEAVASLELAVALNRDGGRQTAVAAAAALADLRSENGEHAEALEAAGTAIALGPDDARAWSALGRARLAAGEAGPAVAALERSARLDPGRPDLVDDLGAAQLASGQVTAAEASFVRALTLDPGYAPALQHLATARGRLASDGRSRTAHSPPNRRAKPVKPKQIGLKFADLEYEKLRLRGALVKEVAKKSPAARAGLRKGDLVLRVGDYGVESAKDFFAYLKRNPPAGELSLELLREGGTERVRLDLNRP